jgi:hypothetical protein
MATKVGPETIVLYILKLYQCVEYIEYLNYIFSTHIRYNFYLIFPFPVYVLVLLIAIIIMLLIEALLPLVFGILC